MWGCGCVFGELLQRVAWIGKATTPQLQVRIIYIFNIYIYNNNNTYNIYIYRCV